MIDAMRQELERVQTRYQERATVEIDKHLDALNKRFPRHKFTFHNAMGMATIDIEPAMFHNVTFFQHSWDCTWVRDENRNNRFPNIFDSLFVHVDAIQNIVEVGETEFNVGV